MQNFCSPCKQCGLSKTQRNAPKKNKKIYRDLRFFYTKINFSFTVLFLKNFVKSLYITWREMEPCRKHIWWEVPQESESEVEGHWPFPFLPSSVFCPWLPLAELWKRQNKGETGWSSLRIHWSCRKVSIQAWEVPPQKLPVREACWDPIAPGLRLAAVTDEADIRANMVGKPEEHQLELSVAYTGDLGMANHHHRFESLIKT